MSRNLSRVTLTKEMADQLSNYMAANSIPPTEAAVVRQALAEFLAKHGFPVTEIHPQRGGNRR